MKTPMQELLVYILQDCNKNGVIQFSAHETFETFLKKEKEVMCQFQQLALKTDFWGEYENSKDCFEKTFNTKEK